MKIALFGGSFDPPHLGHQIVIQQVLELTKIEQIWLLPAYRHTFRKKLSPASHRLQMARFLLNEQIKLNTCEIDNQFDGDTIHPVRWLKNQYPQHQFNFLMGSDQLSSFRKWGQWQILLKEIPFLIYPRAGFAFAPLYDNMTPLKHRLQIITNISSTMVRERVRHGLLIKQLVPDEVRRYIEENKLYK